ncbi:AraC family transcriptional regulator [Vandammella animalimorsus]
MNLRLPMKKPANAPAVAAGAAPMAPGPSRKTPIQQPAKATPLDFVQVILQAYGRYGKDPQAALVHAQITPSELRDPGGCITALQMERLSSYAMRELDDEALGWLSQPLRWGSYGLLARASISAPNLRVALLRWCRHHGLLTRDVQLQLDVQRKQATISVHELLQAPLSQRRLGLLTLLRNIHGFSCWLLDSQIPLSGVQLPFAAPPYAAELARMFPGPIVYGAPCAGIGFDASYLDMPLRRGEAALNQMLQRALLVVVKPYRRDRLVQQRVRQLLSHADGSAHTAQSLARQLHVSVRSLHRFLQDDGTSLQAIKDEVRRDRATQLLARTDYPVKKVAALVGFDNAKSFTRAFTRWLGVSPNAYRRHQER